MKLMIRLLLLALSLTPEISLSLELQTKRHPICGVEAYQTRRDPVCGIELYVSKESSFCSPSKFNSRADAARCGTTCKWVTPTGRNGELITGPGGRPQRTCVGQVPKTCEHPDFGAVAYQTCRHPQHGVELYSECQSPQFGAAQYNLCSFYKTPEQVEAFISETKLSLDTYASILPVRQGELFSRLRNEKALACLIDKYSVDPLYEQVTIDLREKFFLIFGYERSDAQVSCRNVNVNDVEVKVTLGRLDCKSFNRSSLAALEMPPGIAEGPFKRFKQNCSLKISHDTLLNWFTTKADEIDLLLEDLAARQDSKARNSLLKLKEEISSSAQ